MESIKFSFQLVRHGRRTPLNLNDCNTDIFNQKWEGSYILTNKGKIMAYLYGQSIAKRYPDLLTNKNVLSDKQLKLYLMSTSFDRTLESAELCYCGLIDQINGCPISIESLSKEIESRGLKKEAPIFKVPIDSILYELYMENKIKSYLAKKNDIELEEWKKRYIEYYPEILKYAGLSEKDLNYTSINMLCDTIIMNIYDGKKLDYLGIKDEDSLFKFCTEHTKFMFYKGMFHDENIWMVKATNTTLMKNLFSICDNIIENSKQFQISNTPDLSSRPNMWIYSCHDSTFAALFKMFKILFKTEEMYINCSDGLSIDLTFGEESEYFINILFRKSLFLKLKYTEFKASINCFIYTEIELENIRNRVPNKQMY